MNDPLRELVREVAQLTGAAAPEVLADGSPAFRADDDAPFYLVGLIGGKEVGKTALVNALAGQALSQPTGFGRGTAIAIAYAHQSQAEALRAILEREAPGRFQIVAHDLPHLRRQVLLDLPDVDSRYGEHLELTRRMLRHMLFPIWICSIEKYADQQPQKLLAAVAQGNDPANFVFCLNKSDQVEAGALAEIRSDYAGRLARVLKTGQAPEVFLVSAIRPDAFELPRLGEKLAREKSTEDVARSVKLASRQRERSVFGWLDEQQLPERVERLRRLEHEAEELTASRLAQPLIDEVIPRVLDDPGHRLAMTDDLLTRRMARWPLVNLVHTLLSPLLGAYRVSAAPGAVTASAMVISHLRDGGRSTSASVQATFAALHQSHPMVGELYRTRKFWEQMPAEAAEAELAGSLSSAVERQRTAARAECAGHGGILAPVRWLLTVGALLWFPFVQPVLEIFLQQGAGPILKQTALLVVQLLGATYMLKSAGFCAIWFVFLWLYLRWDTARRVNRLLDRWRRTGEGDPSLNLAAATIQWTDDLIEPIREAREQAEAIVKRAEKLRDRTSAAA